MVPCMPVICISKQFTKLISNLISITPHLIKGMGNSENIGQDIGKIGIEAIAISCASDEGHERPQECCVCMSISWAR